MKREELKIYKQLTLPKDSAWERKTYNPITWLRRAIYNKLPNYFLDKIDEKLDDLCSFIYSFTEGIQNLFKWHKTIWKDKNFDSVFIYKILERKIELQREYLIKNNRHLNIETDNKYMTLALNLIELHKNEYYSMEYMDYQEFECDSVPYKIDDEDKDFLSEECKKEELTKFEIKTISENLDEYFAKYPRIVKKLLKQNPELKDSKERLALYIAKENSDRCKKLLFKVLEQNIDCWWD